MLPLFKRQSKELGAMLPARYRHRLSSRATSNSRGEACLGKARRSRLPRSSGSRRHGPRTTPPGREPRSLSTLELVYVFADGLYVKAGFDDRTKARLVIVSTLSNGDKMRLACARRASARARRPGRRSCAISRNEG